MRNSIFELLIAAFNRTRTNKEKNNRMKTRESIEIKQSIMLPKKNACDNED